MTIEIKEIVTVATTFSKKPIDVRRFDWCASFADEKPANDGDPLVGWGETEADAIGDLMGKTVKRRVVRKLNSSGV